MTLKLAETNGKTEAARYYKKHAGINLPQIAAADAVEKFRAVKGG